MGICSGSPLPPFLPPPPFTQCPSSQLKSQNLATADQQDTPLNQWQVGKQRPKRPLLDNAIGRLTDGVNQRAWRKHKQDVHAIGTGHGSMGRRGYLTVDEAPDCCDFAQLSCVELQAPPSPPINAMAAKSCKRDCGRKLRQFLKHTLWSGHYPPHFK